MNLKMQLFFFVASALALSMPAYGTAEDAEEAAVVFDPVVVSASRIPTRLGNLPGNTTVLTRQDIESMNPAGVDDLLRQVPGLHVDRLGGRGGLSSVYVRGGDPNFTVVFIDGIKVNDPTNSRGGTYNFSRLNIQEIERIEIVRGPRSSTYGSDALGGIVNIVTRNPERRKTPIAEVQTGYKDFYDVMAGYAGPFSESAEFSFNVQYSDAGNIVEGSEYVGKTANGKLHIYPTEDSALEMIARYNEYDSESFPDDSGGPEYAFIRDLDEIDGRQATLGFNFDKDLFDWLSLKSKAGFFTQEEENRSPGVAPGERDPFGIPPNTFDSDFYRLNFEFSGVFSFRDASKLLLGASVEKENGDSDGVLYYAPGFQVENDFRLDRSIYSVFMEYRHSWDFGLSVLGGLRADFPDDFEDEFSPSLGAVYHLKATGTTFRANWGQGFKLPSFFALGNPVVGNKDLKPEKSDSFEVGVVQNIYGKRAVAGLTVFYTEYEDLIDMDEGPPPRLVNRSEATAKGVEAELSININESLRFRSHLTYVETDLKNTDEELRNRPEWRAGATVNYRLTEKWSIKIDYLHVGESLDSSIPTGDEKLEEYDRLDAGVVWTVLETLQAGLMIDNVFDANYEEAIGFPAPGFRPWAFARFKF